MSRFASFDPSSGEKLADVERSSPEQVRDAVARAREAQGAWGETPFEQRADVLIELGENILAREEELATWVTQEMGKLLGEARREVRLAARSIRPAMEEVERALAPEVLQGSDCETRVEREPLGVVAAITPWNYPVLMPCEILVPALATGNAVVFKPSEHVPLTGAFLAELFQEVLPSSVLELVQGEGEVGAALVEEDVDMVGFVGSRDTGKKIMEAASGGLKRLVLELGGKDPLVVMGDADLEAAADCVVTHALRNTGQVCCSVERVFVDEEVSERFQELVLQRARDWKHGSGFAEGVHMGPLVSEEQRRKVVEQVDQAVAQGAELLLGGSQPDGPGWFYPATVLANVTAEQDIFHRETFGPVICLTRFDGREEEAVRLANDTPYGLGANVFTQDLDRGRRMARRIRSGQVGINRYLNGAPGAPWVGARQSGFGFLGSVDGHRQFTIPKSICYPLA